MQPPGESRAPDGARRKASVPECISFLAAANQTGSTDEEQVAFSILGTWLKDDLMCVCVNTCRVRHILFRARTIQIPGMQSSVLQGNLALASMRNWHRFQSCSPGVSPSDTASGPVRCVEQPAQTVAARHSPPVFAV